MALPMRSRAAHSFEGSAITLLAIGAAALALAPLAHADSFSAFAGTWYGMRQELVIAADGNGHFTYADFDSCPSCPMASVPRATANFTLTSVAGDTASGTITGDTGAGGHQGKPVSVTAKGQMMELDGAKSGGLYCAAQIASYCGS